MSPRGPASLGKPVGNGGGEKEGSEEQSGATEEQQQPRLQDREEDIGDAQAAKPEQLDRDICTINQEHEDDNGGRNADQRSLGPANGTSTRQALAGLLFPLVLFRGKVLFQIATGDAHRLLLAGGPLSELASFRPNASPLQSGRTCLYCITYPERADLTAGKARRPRALGICRRSAGTGVSKEEQG